MGMVIPKSNRKAIFEALFSEGCLVAPKDFNLPQHPSVAVPNLQVIKAMQSLNSMGHVKTQYNWNWYYYTLTDSGIEYLREWLHLPVEIVPNTHKRQARSAVAPRSAPRSGGPGFGRQDDGYRRRDPAGKDSDAPGGFQPQFRGGFGRGQPTPA